MARTYPRREDGKNRAAVAIWVHPTKEQMDAIEKFANSFGALSPLDLLRRIAEEAIEKAIASNGKGLPFGRELWPSKRSK